RGDVGAVLRGQRLQRGAGLGSVGRGEGVFVEFEVVARGRRLDGAAALVVADDRRRGGRAAVADEDKRGVVGAVGPPALVGDERGGGPAGACAGLGLCAWGFVVGANGHQRGFRIG